MPRNVSIRESRRELAPRFEAAILRFGKLEFVMGLARDANSALAALPEEVVIGM